jgi:hypothetical protein
MKRLSSAPKRVAKKEGSNMLWTIAIALIVLWLLGFFAFHIAGGLIHLLLVLAVVVVIWNFVQGRRRT